MIVSGPCLRSPGQPELNAKGSHARIAAKVRQLRFGEVHAGPPAIERAESLKRVERSVPVAQARIDECLVVRVLTPSSQRLGLCPSATDCIRISQITMHVRPLGL